MHAIIFSEHGGPHVLRYTEVSDPHVGPFEVLVKVHACALNHLDLWVRRGIPGIAIGMPHIPGSDIAGEVVKLGEHVTRAHMGDPVVLAPGISCGHCEACIGGNDNMCRHYTLFGYGVAGGCAEYVKAPEANVIPKPANLSFEEAAAFPLVFLTAWHMLITRAKLEPGEDVLVLAGGSGVGSAAIQIAKAVGARVIATVGSEAKIEKAKALGAEEVILRTKYKFSQEVRRLTDRRGVDVVFEHVGKDTWEESLASLRAGGRLVTCGATTGYDAGIDIRYLFTRQYSILGSYMGTKAELHHVMKMIGRGELRAVIDRVMPLPHCAEAHARMERHDIFGKIVLQP